MRDFIQGYEADIYQGIWKRPMMFGAPRTWAGIWVVICLYMALVALMVLGPLWVAAPVMLWALGQGGLILLTQADPDWDAILVQKVMRQSKSFYDAG